VLVKRILYAYIGLLLFTGNAFGEMAGLELNVNASDVEGKFEFRLPHYETTIMPGAGVLFSDDNYLISNINISFTGDSNSSDRGNSSASFLPPVRRLNASLNLKAYFQKPVEVNHQ